MTIPALLLSALLFGGMTFFSAGFAPVLFAQLPEDRARPLLRGTFPYYHLSVIFLSLLAAVAATLVDAQAALLLAAICVTTIYARQVLMGQINAATDRGDGRAFGRLHGASVVLQLGQIAVAGWALVRLA